MLRQKQSGSSLIEILTVIVIFLVGILALVQAFPTGLALLRTTRSNSLAATLARAEMQRLQSSPDSLSEMIVPVTYRAQGTVIEINANTPWGDLNPPADATNGGQLDQDGQIVVNGGQIGRWDRIGGANKFSRIIGEGKPVPAPRQVGPHFGGLLQLQYGPIYYSRSVSTQIGVPGVLSLYANDLTRRFGDTSTGRPNPTGSGRDYEFYFIDDETAQTNPYSNEDQIWVPIPRNTSGGQIITPLRVRFAFGYGTGLNVGQHEVIVIVDPATAPANVLTVTGNWMVINLRNLVAEPGAFGTSGFNPTDYVGADGGSIRVQRVYQEIPLNQAFEAGNPFQFKALNDQVGSLLINPAANRYKQFGASGAVLPLEARADYTVLDWRIIRDGFRIPVSNSFPSVRLVLGGIKSMSTPNTDGLQYTGVGLDVPNGENLVESTDFVLVDDETGGIILGNKPGATYHSYFVDKRNGVITFVDRDSSTAGVQLFMTVPQLDGTWAAPTLVEASNRSVKAYYQSNGEWSVQVHKPANSYRITSFVGASGLQAGETLVGGTQANSVVVGDAGKIYFPISDLGHRVIIDELNYLDAGGNAGSLNDQEFRIDGSESVGGVQLAFVNISARIGATSVLSNARNGFAVKGLKGASVRVRVLWNPSRFAILLDPNDNYDQLEKWNRETRRVETEGFLVAGEKN